MFATCPRCHTSHRIALTRDRTELQVIWTNEAGWLFDSH